MNATELLAMYDRVADAPDAVGKLRRFVLDLAVRGKLVEQDASEEPASDLLGAIAITKLTRRGNDTAPIAISLLPRGGEPYEVPDGWAWTTFGDVVISRDAERVPVSKEERAGRAKLYDYYGASGVIDKIDSFLFEKPLLLIGEDGANLINRSTPIAFMARGKYWVNNHAHVLDGHSEGLLRYLELYINATDLKPFVTGTAQPKMNQAKMNSIPVALPPAAEQHRIVAKVDELMALCDQLEAAHTEREAARDRLAAASLARLNAPDPDTFQADARFALNVLPVLSARPDQVKQLRQTILNLAVRGKLVPQDPSDEPASKLIAKLATPLPIVDSTNPAAPFDAPAGWLWATMRHLVLHSDAGWSPKTEDRPRTGDAWGVLKVSAVSWGEFRANENKEVLPGTQPRLQAQIERGDFLISRANTAELVARSVIVDEDPVNLMMSDKIVRLRLSPEINQRFICMLNNSADYAREHYARLASGVSPSMKNVSRDVILDLEVPLPPFAEQHRIVAKVVELMAICDQLEASRTAGHRTRIRLLEALLHEALVPVASVAA